MFHEQMNQCLQLLLGQVLDSTVYTHSTVHSTPTLDPTPNPMMQK